MFSITRFQQILKVIPRALVNRLSAQHQAQRYDKSFKTYDHLIALIYGQLSDARSLRELETGFNAQPASYYHLGTQALRRSTLADANQRRNPQVFKALVEHLMSRAQRTQRRELQGLLYLLDSTPIQLRGHGFDWAESSANPHHQGVKVHLLIDGDRLNPVNLDISAANVNDICSARTLVPEAGATYVFDKGYTDYAWWYRLHQAKSLFVTRFKTHAGLKNNTPLPIPAEDAGFILQDEIVYFRYRHNRAGHTNPYYDTPLRRVTVQVDAGRKPLVLATNDMTRPARDIATLYRRRWGVELFFKWLKQHLKIKRFLGRSPNAVLLQLYSALISYLLIWLNQQRHHQGGKSLHLWLVELKHTLFTRLETERQQRYRERRRDKELLVRELQYAMPL